MIPLLLQQEVQYSKTKSGNKRHLASWCQTFHGGVYALGISGAKKADVENQMGLMTKQKDQHKMQLVLIRYDK